MLFILCITFAILNLSTALTPLSLRDCGRTYACWAFPPNCNDATCDGIVRWQRTGNIVHFQWQAKDNLGSLNEGRYSSIGISNDPYMGDDTVLECVFNRTGAGNVQMSFNAAYSNYVLYMATENVLHNSQATLQDGKMICSTDYDLSKLPYLRTDYKKKVHDLGKKKYMLQYAKGLVDPITMTKKVHGTTTIDEFYPWATTEAVQFCESCPDSKKIVTKMTQ